jgi:hypothetical protein
MITIAHHECAYDWRSSGTEHREGEHHFMNRRQFLATSTVTVIAAALKDVPLFGRQGQLTTSFEDLRPGVRTRLR